MMPRRSPIGESYLDFAVGLVTMMSPMWGDLWGGSLLHPAQFVGVGRAIVRWVGEVQKQMSLSGDLTSILAESARMLVIMRGVVGARFTLSPIL